MHTSKKIYSFELSRDDKGHIALKAQQWPWSVLQAITCTPDDFDTVMAKCEARGGLVARHSTDRTFCIIHLGSGDTDGRHPERRITVHSQAEAEEFGEALKDCMAQAAVWFHTNITGHIKID